MFQRIDHAAYLGGWATRESRASFPVWKFLKTFASYYETHMVVKVNFLTFILTQKIFFAKKNNK